MVSVQLSFTSSALLSRGALGFKLPARALRPETKLLATREISNLVLRPRPVYVSANSAESGSINLPEEGLKREFMPHHVAVIMDGNRRWAQMKGLPVGLGYGAGVQALTRTVELCCELGIRVLTVFAFSCDNYCRRPEVQCVRISLTGDSSKLLKPSEVVLLASAMEATKSNSRLHLIVAVNYSGRSDIVQACHKLAGQVKDGTIEPDDINELLVERQLETNCTDFPSPDLLIRTSGELRISNFLLWQLAYTELYFAESLWPDFGEDVFLEALASFQKRQRRIGGQI